MQCEDCRQAIGAEPAGRGAEIRAHMADCADCAAFHEEMLALDANIARALAIDVPELERPELPPVATGVDTGVDLRESGAVRPAGWWWRRSPLLTGLAAGVAVLAVAALVLLPRLSEPRGLAEAVIAHMDHEQASRRVTTVPVAEQALDAVVEPRVSELGGGLGLISYAASCVIRGNTVPHLVVQGQRGPITLILLPDEQTEQAIPLRGEHVHGLILPVGDGSIAIIGGREDQMDEVEATGRRVARSVRWRI